ncbi:MAG: serine/threonine-protein kinase [Polyangia bacterium]
MATQSAQAPPTAPATVLVGSWKLGRKLGGHKSSGVYKAKHDRLGRTACVKVLDARLVKDEEAVSRFFCEARAVAELGAEHLVDIFDFVYHPENGQVAYVMELLRGQDLRHLVEAKKSLAPARAARIAAQLCDALAAVHKAGVVHRDLRPSNIMLVRRGGDPDFVKLLDFGMARFPGKVRHATEVGTQIGSPQYVAPEQAASADVDARADLYAVGAILFHMLTGSPPFRAATPEELLGLKNAAVRAPSPAGDHGAGTVSPALAAIVQRLLARNPADRFPDAASARAALLGAGEMDPWSGDDRTMAVQPLSPAVPSASSLTRLRSYGLGISFAVGLATGLVLMFLR